MAASIVDILIRAKNQASKELKDTEKELSKLDKAAIRAGAALGVLASAAAVQQFARFAIEMAQLNTQIERSAYAFEHFSGGAEQAAANMRAVQRASGGAMSELEAQGIAVTAMTQGLASTSQELERMVRIARGIVSVSPMINDMETAFTQLGISIANQSTLRLDQLGTSIIELKPKIDELKAANKELSSEQAYEIALLNILETKFDGLTSAAVNQATGLERLSAAWRENRAAIAGYFAWVDSAAGGLGDMVNLAGSAAKAMELIQNPPVDVTPDQKAVLDAIQAQFDLVQARKIAQIDAEKNIATLLEGYYRLRDAALQASQAEQAAAKASADAMAAALEQHRQRVESYNNQIEQAGAKAFQGVYEATGNATVAMMAQEQAINKVKDAMRDLPENLQTAENAMMILPAVVSRVLADIAESFTFGGEAAEQMIDPVQKLGAALQGLETFVNGAGGAMLVFARNTGVAQAAAVTMAGAVAAAYDAMEKIYEGPLGLSSGQKGKIQSPILEAGDGMKTITLESAVAAAGVGRVNSEFESLKSTISGIVSGAIGPVAGVDANDLLPRPDAVNENARRLADIAVNGFKGQDWLDEFKNEVPDVYQALVESGDPKTAAAQMLKDFQDGLLSGTGVLIDKERAKDLVRRALLGQANTQSLINEIAQELAAETGTAFSTVQAQAQSILGGGGGLSSDGGTGAAFSRGMIDGVSNSTLGADLGGVVMAQITASVALIEDSGREAGRALVRGVTATFSDIPAAFIAQVAALVTPAVTAALANNGGRTSAAAS